MKFDIITIFPEIFSAKDGPLPAGRLGASGGNSCGYFSQSIIKRATEKGLIKINIHNLRDFTSDKHKTVDDTPYGGGAGMVMKVEPIYKCVEKIKSNPPAGGKKLKTRIILFSAKGKRYTQKEAVRLSKYKNLILICGRYEGVDERVARHIANEEISIGDYILTGGEIPAMVVVDSIARLVPGVLGNEESAKFESHSETGYLEYPQYTKPEKFRDWKVPEVLLNGNHKKIEEWRHMHSKSLKSK